MKKSTNLTVQKDGEIVLGRCQGQFRQAARGTYVSADPVQKYAEVGDVVLTTQPLMFN